jgi:hypothetical protein
VNPNPISFLDDMLLFICLPSFFLYGIFNMIAAIGYETTELRGSFGTNLLMVRIKSHKHSTYIHV